jgi:hypothetical protein
LTISSRFNGPQRSGNGGYASGAVAQLLEGAVEVSLRSPVPLDTPLAVKRGEDGVRVSDGVTLVAEARSIDDLSLQPPAPVSMEEARRASARYRGLPDGEFSHCFVCGRAREDSLEVFAGAVEGRDLVASPLAPPDWTADETGRVRPELVWAVLDCPTYFAAYDEHDELPIAFMARFTARLDAPVLAGEEHVVIAWPIGADGRKRQAGSAILNAAGEVLALAHALLIEPRSQVGSD